MNLKDFVASKRTTLSASSVSTYASILKSLYKRVFPDEEINTEKFNETEKITEYLKAVPIKTRKTILSALFVVTSNPEYRKLMLEDIGEYNKETAKQEKTESQKANETSTAEIQEIWLQLKHNADLLYKKQDINMDDLQQIQQFIILSVLGGMFIPPRRSKDYTEFVIQTPQPTDNYIKGSELVFNKYKTAKTYGEQRVKIPKPLKLILSKWIKLNPTKWLFFDTTYKPLTNVKLNQRLNKIFKGRKIAVNGLRHNFLTDKYKHTIAQNEEIQNDVSSMGTSVGQLTTYIKRD
jgi:hypothetical protein